MFLHGLGASRAQAQAAVAAVEGVESLTIDAPAHGGSAASKVPLNFGAFAHAVIDLLDGSISALRSSVESRWGQESRFVSLATSPIGCRHSCSYALRGRTDAARPHLDIVADIGEWVTSHGVGGARELLSSDERYQLMVECEPLAAASVANAIDGVAKTGRPDVLSAMVDSSPVDDLCELADVGQPAIVISTEHDRLHPVPIAEAIAAALPNATSLLAPPRYLEPEAHQDFPHSRNQFVHLGRSTAKKYEQQEPEP